MSRFFHVVPVRLASILVVAAILAGVPATGEAAGARSLASSTSSYVLAVGDSLAAGYQPPDRSVLPPVDSATGFRDQGYPGSYAADVAASEHRSLVDLACPGETTATMLATPAQALCGNLYRAEFGVSSQIDAATTFLSRTRGRVGLVTIDIGANDVDHCASASSVSTACLASSDVQAVKNLTRILTVLTAAVHRYDPAARVAGMDYYDPFLALEYSPGGITGTEFALGSIAATKAFDTELNATFRRFGVVGVDVASAYRIDAVTPLVRFDDKTVPQDVASVCQLTWMCPSAPGQAPDIHPNSAGYRVIASTFEQRLAS